MRVYHVSMLNIPLHNATLRKLYFNEKNIDEMTIRNEW